MESSIAVFLSRQPACERLLLNQTKRRYAPWTASRDIAHNAVVHRYRHLDPAHGTHTGRTSISDVLHEHTHTHTHTHTRTHARTHSEGALQSRTVPSVDVQSAPVSFAAAGPRHCEVSRPSARA